jgi:hypothetical protein
LAVSRLKKHTSSLETFCQLFVLRAMRGNPLARG